MADLEPVIERLREAALAGATIVELVELTHRELGAPTEPAYGRGVVMRPFIEALDFTAGDLFQLNSCVIFGDEAGATSVEETNAFFSPILADWVASQGSP